MRKIIPVFLFLLLFAELGMSQKKSDFNISIPEVKVEDSKYNVLFYIESRPTPEDMGHVYSGMWNGVEYVTLPRPIEYQLDSLLQGVINPEDPGKTLAVQMRALFFALGSGATRGKASCNLRMTLYEMDAEDKFYFLNTIDTLLWADQKKILGIAGQTVASFIIDNLPFDADDEEKPLNMQEVADIDIYEKNSIPFYTAEKLTDGIYYKYRSLMNLLPDETPELKVIKDDDGDLKEIRVSDPTKPGKDKKLQSKNVYAVISGGIPYISYNGTFFPAYIKDGDWRFILTQKVAGSGFSLGIGIGGGNSRAGGGVGMRLPIGGKKESIEMFIDHLNGDIFWGDKIIKEK